MSFAHSQHQFHHKPTHIKKRGAMQDMRMICYIVSIPRLHPLLSVQWRLHAIGKLSQDIHRNERRERKRDLNSNSILFCATKHFQVNICNSADTHAKQK